MIRRSGNTRCWFPCWQSITVSGTRFTFVPSLFVCECFIARKAIRNVRMDQIWKKKMSDGNYNVYWKRKPQRCVQCVFHCTRTASGTTTIIFHRPPPLHNICNKILCNIGVCTYFEGTSIKLLKYRLTRINYSKLTELSWNFLVFDLTSVSHCQGLQNRWYQEFFNRFTGLLSVFIITVSC